MEIVNYKNKKLQITVKREDESKNIWKEKMIRIQAALSPSQAIIIGKDGCLGTLVDSITMHTARVFSDTQKATLINSLKKIDNRKMICLTGHGSIQHTIGRKVDGTGYNAKDIAKILVQRGYNGDADIYISSCYSNYYNRATETAEDTLRYQNDTEFSKNFWTFDSG